MEDLSFIRKAGSILFVLLMLGDISISAQTKSFDVTLAPFSSSIYDEFSPVFYKNEIVFCSNRRNNSVVNYQSDQKNLFNIFYVVQKDSNSWSGIKLFANELTTNLNDGPVSFDETGNTIYFCRNNNISHHLNNNADASNKLGIYSAEFVNGKWTNIKPFTFDDPLFSFVTPAITPDGKRLYFASDVPGGFGGTDLYYSDLHNGSWTKPVNMGPAINTSKNESFPFATKSGKLFFASDGHEGLGGKDLYYSLEVNGKWINPIHLDSDINSPADDFGLVTDDNFRNGFFSSNRRKTDDIYRFTAGLVQFPVCDTLVKTNYCYLFYDEFQKANDSIPVIYEWDFGNGIKKYGSEVPYCFPGPGNYEVTLNIIDSLHDSVQSSTIYKFDLEEISKAYIKSPDLGVINEVIAFDGLKADPPDVKITDYMWNFGDGFITRGPVAKKTFDKKGIFTVQLGLIGDKDSIGNDTKICFCKEIKIYNDFLELAMNNSKEVSKPGKSVAKSPAINESNTLAIKMYLMNNLSELQKSKIDINLYKTIEGTIVTHEKGIDKASYPVLDKFIKVLNENPDLKLEVAVHTNDKGKSGNNLDLSEKWAQDVNSYFIKNGIPAAKIHCKGFGESRPIEENDIMANSRNKRIEFILLSNNN